MLNSIKKIALLVLFYGLGLGLYAQTTPDGWINDGSSTITYYVGQVSMGTGYAPNLNTGYLLVVDQKIAAEECYIQLSEYWADYVFTEEHNRPTLDELSKFIDQNGHLPKLPPASQVESEGLQMAEATGLLLEKIEELQLYLIEDQERDIALIKQLEEL